MHYGQSLVIKSRLLCTVFDSHLREALKKNLKSLEIFQTFRTPRPRLGRFLEFTDFQLNNAVLGGFNEFLLKQSIKEGLAKAGSFKEASS